MAARVHSTAPPRGEEVANDVPLDSTVGATEGTAGAAMAEAAMAEAATAEAETAEAETAEVTGVSAAAGKDASPSARQR